MDALVYFFCLKLVGFCCTWQVLRARKIFGNEAQILELYINSLEEEKAANKGCDVGCHN